MKFAEITQLGSCVSIPTRTVNQCSSTFTPILYVYMAMIELV